MTQNDMNEIKLETNLSVYSKYILIFVSTMAVYLIWYFLIINSPIDQFELDIYSVMSFWLTSILYFIFAFALVYFPIFKYYKLQTELNLNQAVNYVLSSVFSVFFFIGIFFWAKFIFASPSLRDALTNLFIFSCLILGSFGVIQLWVSTLAMQLVIFLKSKAKN